MEALAKVFIRHSRGLPPQSVSRGLYRESSILFRLGESDESEKSKTSGYPLEPALEFRN